MTFWVIAAVEKGVATVNFWVIAWELSEDGALEEDGMMSSGLKMLRGSQAT